MKIEVNFELKKYNTSWSNQEWKSKTDDNADIFICINGIHCKLVVQHESYERANELICIIWELCALYDGYFYKVCDCYIDGAITETEKILSLNMYCTDEKWIKSAVLVGRQKRDFSDGIIKEYETIRNADRKQESLKKSMLYSFFYLKSEAYRNINIEHRLSLLMNICDGFGIEYLKVKNNVSGSINAVLRHLNREKYKKGAELLGISSNQACEIFGDTRNELDHYIYKKNSLGSYIAKPDGKTDNMVNLYVFYVLDDALRIAFLEKIGYSVESEIKEYLSDEILDWIKLEKNINEKCVIPINQLKQILKRAENQ